VFLPFRLDEVYRWPSKPPRPAVDQGMMLCVFVAVCCASKLYITAEDKNGVSYQFAVVDFQEKSKTPKITRVEESSFQNGFVQQFSVKRKDGMVLSVPAPPNTNRLTFKVSWIDDVPVAIEVSNIYRRQGLQIQFNRVRPMESPVFRQQSEQGQGGGILGLLKRFWYIPLIFLALRTFMGRGAAPQPAQ
jgi:hypothetical protein